MNNLSDGKKTPTDISWEAHMHHMIDAYIAQQPFGKKYTPLRLLVEKVEIVLVKKY